MMTFSLLFLACVSSNDYMLNRGMSAVSGRPNGEGCRPQL